MFGYGWTGRILHVDLSSSGITEFATQPYAGKFLGGRGIAARIYWDTVGPETAAFDPENRLIFMAGPLVATGAQAATQLSVAAKSPMLYPEGYCYGSAGGHAAAELKKAGFDGIVITGRAPQPVYLWVNDGKAELRDAAPLMGRNGFRTGEMLREIHGEKTHFVAIGVSGEKMVRTALALASHRATISAGFGAVMGSKNLKGIAVRGGGRIEVFDPAKLKELARYTINLSKGLNYSLPAHRALGSPDPSHTLERIAKGGCYLCGMDCIRGTYRYGNRLDGWGKCQATDYYLPWQYGRENEPLETIYQSPIWADDYCLDTWELATIVNWLYGGYRAGLFTGEETGLPLAEIGSGAFLEKLMRVIAYREGFGDFLAEGIMRVREKTSPERRALFTRFLAPIMWNDFNPPRAFFVNALLYPLEPRVHHNVLHEVAFINAPWGINQLHPGSTVMTTGLVHDIAEAFWGSREAGDFATYEGKALAAKKIQNRTYIKESLGLCDFGYPVTYSLNTPDNVGDPELAAKLYHAVTGRDDEMEEYGERIANLQRMILLREGRQTPEADYPPEFNFTEPLEDMHHAPVPTVPGPDDRAVSWVGNRLDREKFKEMLREYYRLRGWDEETGIPRAGTLKALGLEAL
jgi:aldehyde:ferredoxin oxidoreductase